MSSIKKNLGYQTIYQLLNTCIPLITSPYLARVLGAEKQGVFSFTQSIVNYFSLIAMLGVMNYGTRTIATCFEKKERSLSFWNVFIMQLITSIIALLLYFLYIVFICNENKNIASIQSLYIFSCIVDINWFYFGIERFKTTVTRSIIIRIITVVLILLFVKSPDDLWLYTLIMSGGTFLSNLILWGLIRNEIYISDLKHVTLQSICSHLKPNLVLFIPILAMSVYHIMDKTMLGILSDYEQVGYYYNADKIINIPIGIISGIGTVMLPRMTMLIKGRNNDEALNLFSLSFDNLL